MINFTNLMRPNNHTNVEDDEILVDPSPSLVLLPDHIIMSKSINMDRLPVVEYAKLKPRSRAHEDEEEEEEEEASSLCAVCLSEIEGGHNVRVLGNCEHAFHVDCLDSWMEHGHATCPLCRAHLVSPSRYGKDPWRSERMVYLFGQDCLLDHLP